MIKKFRTVLLPFAVALSCMCVAAAEEKPIVHEGVVSAPIANVWDALTSKSGQESWMVAHAEIDLRIGGLMRSHYDPKGTIGDTGTIENTIICLDPKRMLSFRVSKPPEGFPFPNEVRAMWTAIYLFPEQPNKTRIRIVGLGFTDDENSQKMRQFFDRGNAFTLKGLQDRFSSSTLAPEPTSCLQLAGPAARTRILFWPESGRSWLGCDWRPWVLNALRNASYPTHDL